MNQQRLEELLIAWEENQLTSEQLAEFKQLLSSAPEARQRLVETGVLGSVAKARVKSWSQPGALPAPAETPRSSIWRWFPYTAAACIALIAWAAVLSKSSSTYETIGVVPAGPRYLAQLSSSEGAVWASGSAPVEPGENLKASTLELASGRVELRFLNGALVAIQGPSQFRLVSEDRISLVSGRLSADVPKRAVGFTVDTPFSAVRDLGTRFGVAVSKDGATEAHVFEGEVCISARSSASAKPELQVVRANEAVAISSDKSAPVAIIPKPSDFPLPARVIAAQLPCPDFELNASGWGASNALPPSEVNIWGGDHIERVGAERGLQPKSGSGMLRFIGAMRPGQAAHSAGSASELFCWIDLRPYRDQFKGRRVTAEFSAWFNRIPSQRSTYCVPTVIAATYGTGTQPGMQAWQIRLQGNTPGHALSNCDAEIRSDEDLATWEQATARVTISPDAELMLLSIRVRNDDGDVNLRRFDDVYADAPALIFRLGDALNATMSQNPPEKQR